MAEKLFGRYQIGVYMTQEAWDKANDEELERIDDMVNTFLDAMVRELGRTQQLIVRREGQLENLGNDLLKWSDGQGAEVGGAPGATAA